MAEKIFISYNHNDKSLIDMIVRRLEIEFGRNNIFYDAWSMQPGDSIIGKMNEGLGEFTTFFLFISADSLKSGMVSLEWQTALNRAVNNNLKFVAVRIAECSVPAILSDKLYIDLYGDGLESAVEKMKKIIKMENCYVPLHDIQNIQVEVKCVDDKKTIMTIKAVMYAEHNPIFAFACENDFNEFEIRTDSEPLTRHRQAELEGDSIKWNAHTVQLYRVLKPGFPLVVEVYRKGPNPLRNMSIQVVRNEEQGRSEALPIKIIE